MPTLRQRWNTTWQRMFPAVPPSTLFDDLDRHYREKQRHYHTSQHLEECFATLDELRPEGTDAAAIELAIWFHDAIYDVYRQDNEARSAAWAASCLEQARVPKKMIDKVTSLIMATQHHVARTDADTDTKVLVDVDLAILGTSPARFNEYERQIRAEYAHVPEPVFMHKRKDILEEFLRRPVLFATPNFHARYDRQARINLTDALGRLG